MKKTQSTAHRMGRASARPPKTQTRIGKRASGSKKGSFKVKPIQEDPALNPAFHRRILNFINEAVSPEDLMYEKSMVVHAEGGLGHQGNPVHEDNPDAMKMKPKMIMSRDTATALLEL